MNTAPPKAGEEHVARVEEVLARVYRRNGYEAVEYHCPLSDLLSKERDPRQDDIDEQDEHDRELISATRQKTLNLMLEYLCADGPHPGSIMRRLYALARAYRPALIADMNGSDLARMFDESRASQSWRVLKMFDGYMKTRGAHSGKLPFQKSEQARRNYSAAQRGNQNRKGKPGRRKTKTNRPKK